MSELHYGKNVEWFLRELSAHEAGDIESSEIEVIGENDQGVEGFTTIDITLLAADAVSVISALHQKLDAVAAENVALKKQSVRIFNAGYSRGHESTVEGNYVHVYQSDFDSFHEEEVAEIMVENTPATDAILNAVRAEGVELVKAHPAISLCSLTHVCEEVANQLRADATKGGSDDKR